MTNQIVTIHDIVMFCLQNMGKSRVPATAGARDVPYCYEIVIELYPRVMRLDR